MPDNGSGVAIPPTSVNPVASGTTIAANWANTTINDIYNIATNRLPRDGQSPMLAPLKLIDGTVTIPAFAFNSSASSGLYFTNASSTVSISVSGNNVLNLTTAGISTTLPITSSNTTGIFLTAPSAGMELGAPSSANTPYIDFHSSGTAANDFDSRIMASGGTTSTGGGTLTVYGSGGLAATVFTGAGTGLTGTAASLTAGSTNGLSSTVLTATNVWQGLQEHLGTASVGNAGAAGSLLVMGNGTGAANVATMTFLRSGIYAINMGLDSDNVFRLGGYSYGTNAYRLQSDTVGNLYAGGGFYPANNSGYGVKTNSGSYGSLEVTGTTAGYAGWYMSGGLTTLMYDTSGNGGSYGTDAKWHFYWNRSQSCLGLGGSNTTAGYAAQVNGALNVTNGIVGSTLSVSGKITNGNGGAGNGFINLQPGGSNTGYVEFWPNPALSGSRQGYIGYSTGVGTTDSGVINYVAGQHSFNGAVNISSAGAGGLLMGSNITRYESGELVIPTTTGVFGASHGGGRKPDIVRVVYRCKTSEGGYSPGDEVGACDQTTDSSRATQSYANATSAGIVYTGSATPAPRSTSGALFAMSSANWRLVIYCHWL